MTNVLRKKPFIIALTKYAGGNSNQVGKTLILKKKIKKNTHLKTLKKKKLKNISEDGKIYYAQGSVGLI
jgi:ribosomal protein S13